MSNVKMKPEIKQRWIDALRSGNYKQGYFKLKTNDCFCVIGVLCDILKNELNGYWKYNYFVCQDKLFCVEEMKACKPPNTVIKYCGFKPEQNNRYYFPLVKYGDNSERSLIKLNDIDRLTFEQLADIIEEQL